MPVELPITGGVTLVDDCDADVASIGEWFVNSRGYVVCIAGALGQQTARLNRLIMLRVLGRSLRPKELVDHVDNNPLNNCRDNLRLATKSQNGRNRGANGNRHYKGVYRSQTAKPSYVAKITVNRRQIYLGSYPSAEIAAAAYNAACRRYHGRFARLNEIQD